LLESNPHSEAAWLWMSTIVDDPEQERACLEKVLEINPNDERAQRRWFELQGTLSPPVRKSTMPASAQQASKPKQPERRKWKLLIVVCLVFAYLFFA
jgi:ferric-dicitrate binding protein FerR (iron transport regulator)